MATLLSEEQGNSNPAAPPADIENVRASDGPTYCQSRGALEISEDVVKEHYYRPLLQAAFKGDWEFARKFCEGNFASMTAKITSRSETVIHLAALSAQDQFFENLVNLLSPHPEALEMVDCAGRTALHNAVLSGRIRMVKALFRSNPKLTQLADNDGRVPLAMASREASMHKEIASFLARNTTDDGPSHPFSSPTAIDFIVDLTSNGHHDITLYLVRQYPHLIALKKREEGLSYSILEGVAWRASNFPSGTKLSVLETLIYKCIPVDLDYQTTDENSDPALQCLTKLLWNAIKIVVPMIKRIHEVKLRHVMAIELAKRICIEISCWKSTDIISYIQEKYMLDHATFRGFSEIIKLCIQFFPELIWDLPNNKLTILAVKYRQERTLRLFLKVSSTNELSLLSTPTVAASRQMMEAVAGYAARECYTGFDAVNKVAGTAFQMQRELQWYKAVESWIIPWVASSYLDGKTYWNKFVENREDLLESAEKWMKDTADKCMLISTLIATVLFAAAFTVPGGNDDKTGVPLLLGQDSLLLFAISDSLGLLSSMTAILLFLAMLTSRYEPQDFLESLPKKIIWGLCFLFLSLAFMLMAFATTLTIVLDKRVEWIIIPITLLASLPVALFARLQLPLLFQMVKSTYGPSIFRSEGIWDGVKYTKQN